MDKKPGLEPGFLRRSMRSLTSERVRCTSGPEFSVMSQNGLFQHNRRKDVMRRRLRGSARKPWLFEPQLFHVRGEQRI